MPFTICLLLAFSLPVSCPAIKPRSAVFNPCFREPYSAECIALIACERNVTEARARTLIGRALNLYTAEDKSSSHSIYKPSAVAVACLASLRALRPGPDSDCVACGTACTQESSFEVCELYCASETLFETSKFHTTSGGTVNYRNEFLIVGPVGFIIFVIIIISVIAIVICRFRQTQREMNGPAAGPNASTHKRALPNRPNPSLNGDHPEEVYDEPFSDSTARQQSDTSRSSDHTAANNQQSPIPDHTAAPPCDTTNRDRLRLNVEVAYERQATESINDSTQRPLLSVSFASPQSPQESITFM